LTSVANVAGKVDKQGKLQDINKAMLSDSVGTVAGAMMGTQRLTIDSFNTSNSPIAFSSFCHGP